MNYYEFFREYWNQLNVSRETFLILEKYVFLLIEENKKFNLIRYQSIKDLWFRHIIDSAQLSLYVSRETKKVADIGSGNGCPGIVLSIMRPDIEIYLIDSKKKKVGFLQKIATKLSLKVTVIENRIENLESLNVECVVARGVALLPTLLQWIQKFLKKDTYCLFLKGESWNKEIKLIPEKKKFICRTFKSLTHDKSKIIYMTLKK